MRPWYMVVIRSWAADVWIGQRFYRSRNQAKKACRRLTDGEHLYATIGLCINPFVAKSQSYSTIDVFTFNAYKNRKIRLRKYWKKANKEKHIFGYGNYSFDKDMYL